ncbi:DNA-binding transcriptional regulator, GntR family [Salinihabitans flavidus]|uniref:DNA-binding transcriptional regulator, GntR family n=1 Tax=Salinihabitans flavidus TaxID=569882 RepID=A0A1H8WEC8_9RHOB|nr:GntR family transcriptional regulator [Salinihabitans flavidus]SEP26025.1 DNA-binding transcriptional regulator, GntR family [Salinihabitans flavidus]
MKQTLTETAYHRIRRDIIECRLAPGSSISEPMLSELLGLGKSGIRAALIRLAHEGLLLPVARQGYVVAPLTLKDARNILDLRIQLEPYAAFLAAGNVKASDFSRVREQFNSGYDLDRVDTLSDFLAANREGRRILGEASGNARLATMIIELVDSLERYLRLGLLTENRSRVFAESHDVLVSLLVAGKKEQAADLSRSQMTASREFIMEALLSQDSIQEAAITSPEQR